MEKNKNYWKTGEVVNLPRTVELIKKSGTIHYERLIGSQYICIQEATKSHRGILVKVLGNCLPQNVMIVDDQPFTKDDEEKSTDVLRYFSYPYQQKKDIKEVLDILRGNPSLLQTFEDASMHIDLDSVFWVNNLDTRLLVFKKAQCYDASSDTLRTISDNESAYRITMVYFFKGELIYY